MFYLGEKILADLKRLNELCLAYWAIPVNDRKEIERLGKELVRFFNFGFLFI